MTPTTILNSVMWLTAFAGVFVALGQLWELRKARPRTGRNVARDTIGDYQNQIDRARENLDADYKRLVELQRKIRASMHTGERVSYRIFIAYAAEGTFEIEVRSPSNEVIDQWDSVEVISSAKSDEIAKARQAIIRDLTSQILGKHRLIHG